MWLAVLRRAVVGGGVGGGVGGVAAVGACVGVLRRAAVFAGSGLDHPHEQAALLGCRSWASIGKSAASSSSGRPGYSDNKRANKANRQVSKFGKFGLPSRKDAKESSKLSDAAGKASAKGAFKGPLSQAAGRYQGKEEQQHHRKPQQRELPLLWEDGRLRPSSKFKADGLRGLTQKFGDRLQGWSAGKDAKKPPRAYEKPDGHWELRSSAPKRFGGDGKDDRKPPRRHDKPYRHWETSRSLVQQRFGKDVDKDGRKPPPRAYETPDKHRQPPRSSVPHRLGGDGRDGRKPRAYETPYRHRDAQRGSPQQSFGGVIRDDRKLTRAFDKPHRHRDISRGSVQQRVGGDSRAKRDRSTDTLSASQQNKDCLSTSTPAALNVECDDDQNRALLTADFVPLKHAEVRQTVASPELVDYLEENLFGKRRQQEIVERGYDQRNAAPLDDLPLRRSRMRDTAMRAPDPTIFAKHLELTHSASVPSLFPEPKLPEIAFAGVSNVGKSSLINALLRKWGKALVSSKPGQTQTVNFYKLGTHMTLVDLPGYGFAFAEEEAKKSWQALTQAYLTERPTLKRVLLMMDVRQVPKVSDWELMKQLDAAGVRYQVVLTKTDLVMPDRLASRITAFKNSLAGFRCLVDPVMPVSAESGAGIMKLRAMLAGLAKRPQVQEQQAQVDKVARREEEAAVRRAHWQKAS
eukprot:jgi/Chlat1/5296/Chrsp35S05244